MSIRLATTCAQIEMAVPDVAAACRAFEDLLGATPVEQDLVRRITGVVLDIDHRWCGGGMFQFCAPLIDDIPARYELDRIGPCVTNLNFFVEDVDEAIRVFTEAGGTVRASWDTSHGAWTSLLGEGNAREQFARGYFMGTRDLLGFDFEMTEPMWHDLRKQQVFCPSFTREGQPAGEKVLRLVRLRVQVDDLDLYLDNLVSFIHPEDRTDVSHRRVDDGTRSARIALRGLELEYVQSTTLGPIEPHVGITTAVFSVADLDAWPSSHFGSRDVLGFDVQLVEEAPTD